MQSSEHGKVVEAVDMMKEAIGELEETLQKTSKDLGFITQMIERVQEGIAMVGRAFLTHVFTHSQHSHTTHTTHTHNTHNAHTQHTQHTQHATQHTQGTHTQHTHTTHTQRTHTHNTHTHNAHTTHTQPSSHLQHPHSSSCTAVY